MKTLRIKRLSAGNYSTFNRFFPARIIGDLKNLAEKAALAAQASANTW